jgi:lipoyl(octanoyl) transferase
VKRTLDGIWLGRRRYAPVHALQERLFQARGEGRIGDTVLFVEHDPVITFGRGAQAAHVLGSEAELARAGVDLFRTGRGGDVTLHLPGQLVAYPILDLSPDRRDVRRYVRDLAETMRLVVASAGLEAGLVGRYIGLWVDANTPQSWPGEERVLLPRKVGAIGVRISRWITMHGFALNLAPDLALYRYIVPCGISEYGVSSVQELGGRAPSLETAAERALEALAAVLGAASFGLRHEPGPLEQIGAMPGQLPELESC